MTCSQEPAAGRVSDRFPELGGRERYPSFQPLAEAPRSVPQFLLWSVDGRDEDWTQEAVRPSWPRAPADPDRPGLSPPAAETPSWACGDTC